MDHAGTVFENVINQKLVKNSQSVVDAKIYLCFHDSSTDEEFKKCRWSNSPKDAFEVVDLATHRHRAIAIESVDGKVELDLIVIILKFRQNFGSRRGSRD